MVAPRRSYLDNVAGLLHVWSWQGEDSALPPLVCLPPVPYGGRFFQTFATELDGSVWSADLPGYGSSDGLVGPPTVGGYTDAMVPMLSLMEQPAWLLGFHSGALVAMEMTNQYPERIAGLILVDVPVFSGPEMAEVRASLTNAPDYLSQHDPLNGLFQAMVVDRLDRVPYERALNLFLDFIGAGEARNAGFHAAANYDARGPSEQLTHPTLVIATNSSLRDGTLQVAEWIPNATLVERADITMPAFELGANTLARATRDFMS